MHTRYKILNTIKTKIVLFASLSLLWPMAFGATAQALTVNWNPVGSYTVDFFNIGSSTNYFHAMNITGFNNTTGALTGNGYDINTPAYTWDMTGSLDGSAISWHMVFTANSPSPGVTIDGLGTIANDGTMSGTADTSCCGPYLWHTIAGAATASSIKDFDSEKKLKTSQCKTNKNSREIVDVSFKLINDYDSGVHGNAWANDTIHRRLNIWKTGANTFCAIVKDNGKFVTFAGDSPNGTGHISAGVKGQINGGYVTDQITGSRVLHPAYQTDGDLGTFNLHCTAANICPGPRPSVDSYVNGWDHNYAWWGWEYNTCHNGNWVNSLDGNYGDITDTVHSQPNSSCRQDKD